MGYCLDRMDHCQPGDRNALFSSAQTKGLLETGWVLDNPFIGWFVRGYAEAINIYYLLPFPLTALGPSRVRAGVGMGDHAFSMPRPPPLLDQHRLRLEARIANTDHTLNRSPQCAWCY